MRLPKRDGTDGRRARILLVLCASFLMAAKVGAAEAPIVRAMQLAREAATAMEANNAAAAVEKLEVAAELRGDLPRILVDLAVAQVAAERPDDAIATLSRYAKLGVYSPVDKASEFEALKTHGEFKDVTKQIAANLHPKGRGEIAFSLRDVTGLIEGIAWRESTGEFYFGDVHHRTVWASKRDGSLRRVTPEGDDLLGVHGLAIDEANGILWAATAAVPAMRGFSPAQDGTAALVEIDLTSGAIRRTLAVPRVAGSEAKHVLSDVALAPDGSVYVVDSAMPLVWRLKSGADALEQLPESAEYFSLQGIAIVSDGTAVLADQVNGLVRVNMSDGSARRLDTPADVTLLEINSLVLGADGRLLALQTGFRPNRVLAITVDGSAESVVDLTVLETGHIAMGEPSQGCIGPDGDLYFIGNAGWSRFATDTAEPTAPRRVPIFRTKISTVK